VRPSTPSVLSDLGQRLFDIGQEGVHPSGHSAQPCHHFVSRSVHWLADRVGRKVPLMLSILWYSICNFIAGFSSSFTFLFVVRAMFIIGMGAIPSNWIVSAKPSRWNDVHNATRSWLSPLHASTPPKGRDAAAILCTVPRATPQASAVTR
jgi:Sugar (and other) transporter